MLMVDPERRPTAQEIEELIDLVRRDPGSPAFIDLGEAYLSLGRPRDAVQVGNLGLEASPDSLEGRVMLARAFASMHQWKEAQGELLRVVKVDRSNRQGFALLGEVLLRRNDYERAVPVLQHAQNLDPTSPAILSMLRRARAGQPLDPPAPLPTPIPPRGETHEPMAAQVRGAAQPPRPRPPAPALETAPAPPVAAAPSAPASLAAPGPSTGRGKLTAPPPPMSVEGIRPRIVSGAKPQNAAAASLRQSAAVGENYLNELLTNGLLDVAGVRVPDHDFDLKPDRRWGRSTRRAFIFLFVVLVLGIGGGGTWYWWTEKQKSEAVVRLQKESKAAIAAADFNGLEQSLQLLGDALEKDNANLLTFAYVVETAGLEALLYGTDTDRVDAAIKAIGKDISAGEPGAREVVIGKAALELSRLHRLEAPATTLGEVNKLLDEYLAKHGDDPWARWLKGRAHLAAGEREAARGMFKAASAGEGEAGLVVALVDLADLLVDDGKLDEALALYKTANERAKDHPLVVLGRSIGRAEASVDADEVIGDLNAKLIESKLPPRLASYRVLALAIAYLGIEDYPKAIEQLKKATMASKPPGDPRFWARAAWVNYVLGDLAETAKARAKCVWYSKKPEVDPTVQLVDAALLLASGLPDQVLDMAAKLDGLRPKLLRTYALLDLGKGKEALALAEEVLAVADNNTEAKILREHARLISSEKDRQRNEADEELERLARKANSKIGRHALGVARLAIGKVATAKDALEAALLDVSDTSPNPLAYRTLTALAEVALATNNDVETAGKYLDWALNDAADARPELTLGSGTKIRALDDDKKRTPYADFLKANTGYFPTRAMQARVVLRNQEYDKALGLLEPLLKESAGVQPAVQLTFAEALILRKGSTAGDKAKAKEILASLKDRAPAAELGRIAALIDPKLPEELGFPAPAGGGGGEPAELSPKKPPPKKPPRRRGR